MQKRLLLASLSILFILSYLNVKGQNNCPSLPKKGWFDTLGYIKTEIPTDPAKANGIWLGQGTTAGKPGFIPTNHPGWAIGIAHAWNYSRNMVQRVEYPHIGLWMATLIQESELVCAQNSSWGAIAQEPVVYQNLGLATFNTQANSIMSNGGCYQIEGPGSAWGALGQGFPAGRFPVANYNALNQSATGGDTQPLVKAYYDFNTAYVFNYYVGWPFFKNVDCKVFSNYDVYGYEKMVASAYNAGPNGFLSAHSILLDLSNSCWTGLPATTAGYAESVAARMAVVENNPGYCGGWPAGSSFGGYYNANITWTNVTSYLTNISVMYPEITFATQVTPKVQTAFVAKAGSTAGTIPFQQLGSVIDAIILALPAERPSAVEGSPVGVNLNCSGNTLPAGHVEILDGSTTMCLGNSVTLQLDVDAGGGTTPTFKWYKGPGTTANMVAANLIGTNQTITITPSATGVFTYSAQICNSSGCYTVYSNSASGCQDSRDLNGFKITVSNCSSCTFTAIAASVNTPCKGMNNGQINLTLTNAPANYKVTYDGTTPLGAVSGTFNSTGSTVPIPNLRDGAYNIVLENLSDPTCKAYTNVIVNYTTLVNEYIDAVKSPQAANACTANITATLKELPASCNWKIRSYVDVYFQWENWVNFGITTSAGISTMDKNNITYPAALPPTGIDQWNAVPASEQVMSLNTGDHMDFEFALTTTPGATQIRAYTVQVFDENNTLVYTAVAPAGASNSAPYTIPTGYTVTCPTPVMPAYTFSWSPSLATMTNTATTSSGTVNINFATPTVYTVTATHPTNSQCKLTDTVIVQPTCPGGLPVELLYFNASAFNRAVELTWATSKEKDCKLFTIEKSYDGISFEPLVSINCRNALDLSNYSYSDRFPYSGTSYYRLVQYDKDDKFYYSEIAVVTFNDMGADIYPNPFTSDFNVQLIGEPEDNINVKVLDVEGRELSSQTEKGNAKFTLGSGLNAGIYVVQIQDQSIVKTYKIVKE